MTVQKYNSREAIDRIYRVLRGDVLSDVPNTLTGEIKSTDEVLSRLAELLQNSLPGEQFTIPHTKIGSSDDYVEISASGTISFNGYATVWDDLRFPIETTKLSGVRDPDYALFKYNGTGSTGVFIYWFSPTSEEEVFVSAQMPHSWKMGSVIHPHVHWTPAANGTGTVSWGLEYTWANIDGVFGGTNFAYGNTPSNGFVNISGSVHYLTPISGITGTSYDLSSMLLMRLFRNATGGGGSGDSYPSDAGLLEFDLHYEMDSFGSNELYEK